MSTPIWTQDDLQTVSTAIASGVLEVRFADRTVTYRSIKDLLVAQQAIQTYLDKYNGVVPTRQMRIWTSNGWDQ